MRGRSSRFGLILVFCIAGLLLISGLLVIGLGSKGGSSGAANYDYRVSSNVVEDSSGGTAYRGSDFGAALQWATSHSNKVVYVPAGVYEVRSSVTPFADGVTLFGDGQERTIFNFVWPEGANSSYDERTYETMVFGFYGVDVNNVALRNFTITGDGAIRFDTTKGTTRNNLVEDVTIRDTSDLQISAFGSWVSYDCVADGYKFIRCTAYNTGGGGFNLWGREYTAATILAHGGTNQNTYFEDCKALYCGYSNLFWDWAPGFDIGERGRTNHVTLVRCEASYNWESGFHLEDAGGYPNFANTYITMTDCVANYNGQKWSDQRGATYGYGCAEGMPTSLTDPSAASQNAPGTFLDLSTFSSVGNPGIENGGVYGWRPRYAYDSEFATGTTKYHDYYVSSKVVKNNDNSTAYVGADFGDALRWSCRQADKVVYVPKGNYTVNGTVQLATGVTLYGASHVTNSTAMTVLNFENGGLLVSKANNTKLCDLLVKNGGIRYSATNGTMMTNNSARGVTILNMSTSQSGGFSTFCDSTSSIDGLNLGSVVVKDSHINGFEFGGAGGSAFLRNLSMLFCKAENCGLQSPRDDSSVGFRFGDGVNMDNVSLYNCDANNNWCSGFFFSSNAQFNSVALTDCSANNNGQKGDKANGLGYQLNNQTSIRLNNCGGTGNKGSLIS